jgi:hypothetical protein
VRRQRIVARVASGGKTCGRCRCLLPLSDFGPQRSAPDKHHAWCRSCVAAYARDRRDQRRRAAIDALMSSPQGRTAVVALSWRLSVTAEEAQRVALLVEPAWTGRGPARRWETDRPRVIAAMTWAELVKLARRARVRPGGEPRPSRRAPTVEEVLRHGRK